MLESEIQASLIKELERQGYYVIKLISTNKPGIPDLLALKQGQTVFIEVKRKGGKISPLQLKRHLELRQKGIQVLLFIENKFVDYEQNNTTTEQGDF